MLALFIGVIYIIAVSVFNSYGMNTPKTSPKNFQKN